MGDPFFNPTMKINLSFIILVLFLAAKTIASSGIENPWGPVTNSVRMSVLARNDAPSFKADEINDAPGLIVHLKQHSDPVSAFLWEQASSQEKSAFTEFQTNTQGNSIAHDFLANFLNRVLAGPCILTNDRFRKVFVEGETALLLEQRPSDTNLVRLNQRLLEAVYPFELARSLNPDGVKFKKGEPVTLTVSFSNVSTNGTLEFSVDFCVESSRAFEFQIETPSGKQIVPPRYPRGSARARPFLISAGSSAVATFHLSQIYPFDEVGLYVVTARFGIPVQRGSPEIYHVTSNPLKIRIVQ
jgi:hypothetical protein